MHLCLTSTPITLLKSTELESKNNEINIMNIIKNKFVHIERPEVNPITGRTADCCLRLSSPY